MTFADWLAIWINSEKLDRCGRGRGKYCMARLNDLGDYAVGNVEIWSHEENCREAKLGRPIAQSTRDKMSATQAEVVKPPDHRANLSLAACRR